jgi:hypothetical protein
MDMTTSFRKCKVSDGFISVTYNGTPNFGACRVNDVKNVEACQAALTEAITKLVAEVDAGEREPGTFYISIIVEGRKVRGFDAWEKSFRSYVTLTPNESPKEA